MIIIKYIFAGLVIPLILCGTIDGVEPQQNNEEQKEKEFKELLLADYQGINPEPTEKARRSKLRILNNIDAIKMEISNGTADWEQKIILIDPELTDGDRGFMWQLSRKQVEKLILPSLRQKGTLTLSLNLFPMTGPNKPSLEDQFKTKEIREWAKSLGFNKVIYDQPGSKRWADESRE